MPEMTTDNKQHAARQPFRVSKRRQMRKWLVCVFGRRRQRQNIAVAARPAKYSRPDAVERLLILQLVQSGLSAREVGRRLSRDHHTVTRHAAPSRLDDLASALALAGHYPEARSILKQHGQSRSATATLIAELEDLARRRRRPLPPFPF
jgi:hypothetical protein